MLRRLDSVTDDSLASPLWLSRIDKDDRERRDAAVQSLYLQCYTQEEIADAVGMPRKSVDDLLAKIRKYEIPPIPGIFTENAPPEDATQKCTVQSTVFSQIGKTEALPGKSEMNSQLL